MGVLWSRVDVVNMTMWKELPVGKDPPNLINVIVETPKGSKNKYEVSKEYDAIVLDRVLHSSVVFPLEYGMVPRTFYEDGDAIDAMVVMSEPTFNGCIVEARPIGLLRMRDENGADDKVLCAAVKDPRNREYHDLSDLPTHYLDEIAEFFRTYKHLEEGKNTEVLGWEGRKSGLQCILDGMALFKKHFD
jgi:inorganic pyrophosphatase